MGQRMAPWILGGTTILWLLLGVLAVVPAMFSVMMFDAPGSEKNVALIIFAISLVTFPLVCAAAVVLSWVLFAARAPTFACCLALMPLANLVIGGAAFAWIAWVDNGQFAP